jgi:hypothetical protein
MVALAAILMAVLAGVAMWWRFRGPRKQEVRLLPGYYCVTYVDATGNETSCIPTRDYSDSMAICVNIPKGAVGARIYAGWRAAPR